MKRYFLLQFRILHRRMIDFGLPPFIGYTLLPLLFVVLSNYLFDKTEFAIYVYGLLFVSTVSKLNEPKRNDFLKSIFNKINYRNVRILENGIYSIPFILFLIYKQQFVFSLVLILLSITLALFNFSITANFTIPTPFGKRPFEFPVGFRKTFYLFPLAYLLAVISIVVGNFNLGIFSILLFGFCCFSYYSTIENDYYIWNFRRSPEAFLLQKAKTGICYFTLLLVPNSIVLSIAFFDKITIFIICLLVCYAYLLTIIFAKYSCFPNDLYLSQRILLIGSFIFPPLLVITIPYFYQQSIKKLTVILE